MQEQTEGQNAELVSRINKLLSEIRREANFLLANPEISHFSIDGVVIDITEFASLLAGVFCGESNIFSLLSSRFIPIEVPHEYSKQQIEDMRKLLSCLPKCQCRESSELFSDSTEAKGGKVVNIQADAIQSDGINEAAIGYVSTVVSNLKAIERDGRAAFKSYVEDRQKKNFVVNGISISLDELLFLISGMLCDGNSHLTEVCNKPCWSKSVVMGYDSDALRNWFKYRLFELYHVERLPGSLLPPVPEIIPIDWLDK